MGIEKLVVVVLVATLVLGPTRLPGYAERLAAWARGLRGFVDAARTRTEADLGVPVRADAWHREVQRYDPRRIVRDALAEPPRPSIGGDCGSGPTDGVEQVPSTVAVTADDEQPSTTRTRWVVAGGSSGHPRRIRVVEQVGAVEPEQRDESHPAGLAAEREPMLPQDASTR